MTALELVVVLGIVAGATAMAAASIPKLAGDEPDAALRLDEFVRETRLAALRSGQPALLEIRPGKAKSGERHIDLAGDIKLLVRGNAVSEYRAVVSADGIIAGEALSLDADRYPVAIGGVYRAVVR
jgi:hypothetical protein